MFAMLFALSPPPIPCLTPLFLQHHSLAFVCTESPPLCLLSPSRLLLAAWLGPVLSGLGAEWPARVHGVEVGLLGVQKAPFLAPFSGVPMFAPGLVVNITFSRELPCGVMFKGKYREVTLSLSIHICVYIYMYICMLLYLS